MHTGYLVPISGRASPATPSLPSASLSAKFLRTILLVCTLFALCVSGQNWACPTPQGSYLKSCVEPKGFAYRSTDPVLKDLELCSYWMKCKRVNRNDHDQREGRKILAREDTSCGATWENCDGYLVARPDGIQRCNSTNQKEIEEELHRLGLPVDIPAPPKKAPYKHRGHLEL